MPTFWKPAKRPKTVRRSTIAHKQRAAAKARAYAVKRAACRKAVYARAEGCCERCGVPLILEISFVRHEFEIAHIDEIVPRSLGGDPTDPANGQCLCFRCHAAKTEHRS